MGVVGLNRVFFVAAIITTVLPIHQLIVVGQGGRTETVSIIEIIIRHPAVLGQDRKFPPAGRLYLRSRLLSRHGYFTQDFAFGSQPDLAQC
ncbi:MAG: hypothetical protein JWP57_2016 [Spirosoma sp.]|nr:hypothetical protein [Spirosoma sp.]